VAGTFSFLAVNDILYFCFRFTNRRCPLQRIDQKEVEKHIDPTDFIAFNKYKENLSIFTEVARNTDSRQRTQGSKDSYDDHWTVVNTCNRYPARLQLLKTFEKQMKRYALTPTDRLSFIGKLFAAVMDRKEVAVVDQSPLPQDYVEDKQKGVSIRAVLQTFVLAALLYFYAYITWKFDIMHYAVDF
jgi:hypothetical protein